MIVEKEVILKIELKGEDIKEFKDLLETLLAANRSANMGLGFLNTNEVKYVERILKSLNQ